MPNRSNSSRNPLHYKFETGAQTPVKILGVGLKGQPRRRYHEKFDITNVATHEEAVAALTANGGFDHIICGVIRPPTDFLPEHKVSNSRRRRDQKRQEAAQLRMTSDLASNVLASALTLGKVRGQVIVPIDACGSHPIRGAFREMVSGSKVKLTCVKPSEDLRFLLGHLDEVRG